VGIVKAAPSQGLRENGMTTDMFLQVFWNGLFGGFNPGMQLSSFRNWVRGVFNLPKKITITSKDDQFAETGP